MRIMWDTEKGLEKSSNKVRKKCGPICFLNQSFASKDRKIEGFSNCKEYLIFTPACS